jgi:hypothetical protein
VAQTMWGHPARNACRGGSSGEGARQHTITERRVTVVVGAEPTAVAMGPAQQA